MTKTQKMAPNPAGTALDKTFLMKEPWSLSLLGWSERKKAATPIEKISQMIMFWVEKG